ncbi:IclR family transcriptional regulator [Alicyclobacillus cycloheptanicus]|uniref:DNA-binding IclR family transcriptional regulator n=1 Tax=Alicyclobacillus cycloheptanicus TaxID=1457 RepID=A0ABT9XIY2_9BACL|nr:IclR family transcriptional regulator [Alicyclobacillus cycloheptanicus]MDQ0190268.1 DNA-binding IclR family transcriptional regulator [Alicyclobacillus cycloheptanicus]
MLSSVHHVVMVLRAFRLDRPEMSLADLSRATGLPKSTANKCIHTLVTEGFLERVEGSSKYRPSLRMFEIGNFVLKQMELVREATPLVRHLAKQTGETAHLTYYENGEVIWLLRVDSPTSYQLYSRVGRRAPAMAAASGKAILAFLSEDALSGVLEKGWRKLTIHTNASREVLLRDLERVRVDGYSFQAGEVDRGIASVGAPIFNHRAQAIASVSVAGPIERFHPDAVRRIGRLAIQTGLAISERLGYRGVQTPVRGGLRNED